MISRVADHCFWLGRYLERAESTARVLVVTGNLARDAELTAEQCWLPVIIVSGERAHFADKCGVDAARSGEVVERYMTWDEDNLTSIVRSVGAARENARSIREVVSLEAWETINELYLFMTSAAAADQYRADRIGFYRTVRKLAQLALGFSRSTMLHDTPLDFIWLGVMLERLGQTARVLDVHHHAFKRLVGVEEVVETALWLSLLRACSGYEPFMKRHQGIVRGEAVAAFLLFEPAFPRSIRFCLEDAAACLCRIRPPAEGFHGGAASGPTPRAPREPPLPGAESAARLDALVTWLRARAREPLPADVHDLLTHVVDESSALCNALAVELFGYGPPRSAPPQAQVQEGA